MMQHVGVDTKPDVGERADRQWNLLADEARDELRVLDRPHAVIDAVRAELVQSVHHEGRRPLFAGVGHRLESKPAGSRKVSANFAGGSLAYAESSPTPTMRARHGSVKS